MTDKIVTGKNRGFKKGDFVYTGAYPAIIVSDVQTFAPCCEVWGAEHETGSVYAEDLEMLTYSEWIAMLNTMGYDGLNPNAYGQVAKDAIEAA